MFEFKKLSAAMSGFPGTDNMFVFQEIFEKHQVFVFVWLCNAIERKTFLFQFGNNGGGTLSLTKRAYKKQKKKVNADNTAHQKLNICVQHKCKHLVMQVQRLNG